MSMSYSFLSGAFIQLYSFDSYHQPSKNQRTQEQSLLFQENCESVSSFPKNDFHFELHVRPDKFNVICNTTTRVHYAAYHVTTSHKIHNIHDMARLEEFTFARLLFLETSDLFFIVFAFCRHSSYMVSMFTLRAEAFVHCVVFSW